MYKRKYVIAKTILWRLLSLIITVVLSYAFTGNATLSVSIGTFDLIIKTVFHCWYENIWLKILLKEFNEDIDTEDKIIH